MVCYLLSTLILHFFPCCSRCQTTQPTLCVDRDEPTNHLDSAAVKWLGGFLRKSGGTVVRGFLGGGLVFPVGLSMHTNISGTTLPYSHNAGVVRNWTRQWLPPSCKNVQSGSVLVLPCRASLSLAMLRSHSAHTLRISPC